MHANRYNNLEQLRTNVEEFIEHYYNQQRLHSALSHRECTVQNRTVAFRFQFYPTNRALDNWRETSIQGWR